MTKEEFDNLKIGDKLYVTKDGIVTGYFPERSVIVIDKYGNDFVVAPTRYNRGTFNYRFIYLTPVFPKCPEYLKND